MSYQIFFGAPRAEDIDQDPKTYYWQTVSSSPVAPSSSLELALLPPATLEAASRRISLIYQNIIFREEDEADQPEDDPVNQTTMITWPPTQASGDDPSRMAQRRTSGLSFLDPSISHHQSRMETQETRETQSYNYSDASSIARFPSFHFDLHSLTSLENLSRSSVKGSRKVSVLLAVLEVEGPDTIRIKKGADAGNEISLLKVILGDEDGNVCKLTAWRGIAELWGGSGDALGVKRGDIVLIENVTASYEPATSPVLSASPYLNSKLEICYRTMPYSHEDMRLRPDLRLGGSDASVRKVDAVVRWFEGMAGLPVGQD